MTNNYTISREFEVARDTLNLKNSPKRQKLITELSLDIHTLLIEYTDTKYDFNLIEEIVGTIENTTTKMNKI